MFSEFEIENFVIMDQKKYRNIDVEYLIAVYKVVREKYTNTNNNFFRTPSVKFNSVKFKMISQLIKDESSQI